MRKRNPAKKRTTLKPRKNVLKILPELRARAAVTVRLHPRKGTVRALSARKMGGDFLWPAEEPWPVCNEKGPPARWKEGRPDWWDDPWMPAGRAWPLVRR